MDLCASKSGYEIAAGLEALSLRSQARLPGRHRASMGRQRNLIVDQGIDRSLDVNLGIDHASLLQREAGGEDGLALRRANPAMGEFGSFLQLLVDHRVRQVGDADECFL